MKLSWNHLRLLYVFFFVRSHSCRLSLNAVAGARFSFSQVVSNHFTVQILVCNSSSCGASYYCWCWFCSHTCVHRKISVVFRIHFWCDNSSYFSICTDACTFCTTMAYRRFHCKSYRLFDSTTMMMIHVSWFWNWARCVWDASSMPIFRSILPIYCDAMPLPSDCV